MNTTVQTKFGRASILPHGYYVIHSKNENRSKLLHRLIWEDFYECEIDLNKLKEKVLAKGLEWRELNGT